MDGVAVLCVHRVRARSTWTPALLLQEGRPVRVQLAAHRERGTDWQVRLRLLGRRIHEQVAEVKGRGGLRSQATFLVISHDKGVSNCSLLGLRGLLSCLQAKRCWPATEHDGWRRAAGEHLCFVSRTVFSEL